MDETPSRRFHNLWYLLERHLVPFLDCTYQAEPPEGSFVIVQALRLHEIETLAPND
jgi:hypothetical protein